MKTSPPERAFPGRRMSCRALSSSHEQNPAFTLVEMLVVMAVVVALVALTAPVINGIKNASDVNKAVYDIAGILEQSRAYAMSNNTYVYVGFGEADANTSASGKQTFNEKTIGRVYVAAVATKDGSRGYDANTTSPSESWKKSYSKGKNLLVIGKAQAFTGIHLVNLGQRPKNGGMARPPYKNEDAIDGRYNVGDLGCVSVTPIYYPVGTEPDSATVNYTFTKVIQFDPQGAATIQTDNNTDLVPAQIEIGLQQARGNTAPTFDKPVTTGNFAALQIDGMMGSTRIYRP